MNTKILCLGPALGIRGIRSAADYFANNVITILALAFVYGIGAFFMWQAPSIASQIVSGAGAANTRGFGGGAIGKVLRAPF